jgi:hypothetical protein
VANLSIGKCNIKSFQENFVTIQQNEKDFFYKASKSADGRLLLVWKQMLNQNEEKSNQVCFIDNNNVVWTRDFRRALNCKVSNNGTVAVLDLNPTEIVLNGKQAIMMTPKVVIVRKDGAISYSIGAGERAEIMAIGISPDGKYLSYSLQKYHPNNYYIVLFNLETGKEEWRYQHSEDIVIHDLVLNDLRTDVFAGPRPSAFVNKKYSFSLNFSGNRFEDPKMNKAVYSTSSDITNGLLALLSNVAPTVMVETEEELGPKGISPAMTKIMNGEVSLPAVRIMLSPTDGSDKQTSEKPGDSKRFFFRIEVVAETSDEVKETAERTIKTIDDNEDDFVNRKIAISRLHSRYRQVSRFWTLSALRC